MPEGPEVWILSKMINNFYLNNNTISVGKHIIIQDLKENWSFGLNGKSESTIGEIADTIGLGQERCRQIKKVALSKMAK